MKLAIISDIHSNLYALMNVLEDIDDKKVDSIICLGDLIGYGPHPNETVSLIKRRNILCIKGNYDMAVVNNSFDYIKDNAINSEALPWSVNELRAQNRYFLDELPTSLELTFNNKTIKFVHGSPNSINEYLYEDKDNTKEIMKNLSQDILVCAHTHMPSIKNFEDKLFICCGSVGKPKIGNPNSTYCILDIHTSGKVDAKIYEVEYEVKKLIKDMEMLKFPTSLIRSFEEGRDY